MTTKKTGLYIGRFQPFHLGHLSAIKQALKQVDELIIGIGSAQYSCEPKNPFTAEERVAMIEAVLKEEKLEKGCKIIPIPDIHDNEKWVEHVKEIVPKFDTVFVGNNGIVKQLFKNTNTLVKNVDLEKSISATRIRKSIKKGSEEWKKMVHSKVIKRIIKATNE